MLSISALLIAAMPLIRPSSPEVHPVHLSVMEIYRDEKTRQIGMSVTLFMDDFGDAIHYQTYEKQIQQGKIKPESLMERYLQQKLTIKMDGERVAFRIQRTENSMGAITCYLRLEPERADVRTIAVENQIFLELFDDQRNMVQIQIPGKKSGMLSLDRKKTSGLAEL
ncbi:MAG: hypothetical protein IPH16_14525 [Haliscomenobacter sp.]|nr:hypothetical protein [Haliscomenobacter sp.]MBK8878248.1 hypothetical protein [Haliscomenobacter sp.]